MALRLAGPMIEVFLTLISGALYKLSIAREKYLKNVFFPSKITSSICHLACKTINKFTSSDFFYNMISSIPVCKWALRYEIFQSVHKIENTSYIYIYIYIYNFLRRNSANISFILLLKKKLHPQACFLYFLLVNLDKCVINICNFNN